MNVRSWIGSKKWQTLLDGTAAVSMKRGDLVLVALKGSYGKVRPAVVIQSNHFPDHPSVVILPFTSHLDTHASLRVPIHPTPANGLRQLSWLMIDKPHTVDRDKIPEVIGSLASGQLAEIDRALTLFLGIGDR